MSNRFQIIILMVLTLPFCSHGQKINKQFLADSIFIYTDFQQGGTTANLWHNHRDLDSTKAKMSKLSDGDLDEFIDILNGVKRKKLLQQKYGAGISYLLVYRNNHKTRFILFATADRGLIHDLDNMNQWTLRDPVNRRRFYELIKKYRP